MLRIATLNLLKETDRLSERLDLLVDSLKFENLDFLCLQEVPGPERAGFYVGDVLSFKLGMDYKIIGETKDGKYGNVTISRHPLKPHETDSNTSKKLGVPMLATYAEVDGQPVYVFNAHFPWGAQAESKRLEAAAIASRMAEDMVTRDTYRGRTHKRQPIVFLAGDLNCTPESRTVRYLRGLDIDHEDRSSLWLDAWSESGPANDPGFTSGEPNHWSVETFKSVGSVFRPTQMPRRRIDYVMSYGWVWGNPGQPVEARIFGERTFFDAELGSLPVSDHKGVIADFWTPEPDEV